MKVLFMLFLLSSVGYAKTPHKETGVTVVLSHQYGYGQDELTSDKIVQAQERGKIIQQGGKTSLHLPGINLVLALDNFHEGEYCGQRFLFICLKHKDKITFKLKSTDFQAITKAMMEKHKDTIYYPIREDMDSILSGCFSSDKSKKHKCEVNTLEGNSTKMFITEKPEQECGESLLNFKVDDWGLSDIIQISDYDSKAANDFGRVWTTLELKIKLDEGKLK